MRVSLATKPHVSSRTERRNIAKLQEKGLRPFVFVIVPIVVLRYYMYITYTNHDFVVSSHRDKPQVLMTTSDRLVLQ